MHQTFYIEADEEISSVIEKLRKSLATENYFVVTKRALVVQSIVNLKLLKREAEKFNKSIILITTDDQIAKMADRAGITVQTSMDGLDFVEEENVEIMEPEIKSEMDFTKQKKKRLVKVGSADYHGENSEPIVIEETENEEIKNYEEVESVAPETVIVKKTVRRMDDFKKNVDLGERSVSDGIRKLSPKSTMQSTRRIEQNNYDLKESLEAFLDPDKEKKVEKMFNKQNQEFIPNKEVHVPIEKNSGLKNSVFTFVLVTLVVFAGVFAYLFIPKADVIVYLDAENKQVNSNITGDVNLQAVDVENLKIPARVIEKESEITLSNESTGVSESTGQKAKGTLVIYNEYSNAEQPLIATTRFETQDGKIFRLVKGVSVPGMTNVGGESKPGAIEVEVIADMPGESYNIEASAFTIPGFKGTDKFDKIYAKSSKAMLGGGLSGDAVKIVSQSDIDAAKEKTENAIKEKIMNLVNGEVEEGEVALSQESKIDIMDSISYAKSGDLKNSFDYQVRAKIKIFVVSEKDIKSVIEKTYKDNNKKPYGHAINDIKIGIDGVEPDFENRKVSVKVSAQVLATPVFDSVDFKHQLVAKDENQIREMMKNYPQVKNLEISVEPVFLSSTPRFENRIGLEVREFEAR